MNFLYEKYHSKRKKQRRIIDKSDFTYQEILGFLKRYNLTSKKILDIGCGVGTIDFYLGNIGAHVLGIDISQKAIEIARKNTKNFDLNKKVRFEVLDFPKSIPKGKYDVIICSEVLEHLKDDKKAVVQIIKLLEKTGIVITSSPSLNAPLYKIGLLKNFDKEVGHLRRYTERSFKNLFERAGFKVLEAKKTEGILRNFLFTNNVGGQLLRIFNKKPFSNIVTFIDNLTIPLFGESDVYLVVQIK